MLKLATIAALGGLALLAPALERPVDPLDPARALETFLPRRSLVVVAAPSPDALLRGLTEDPRLTLLSGLGDEDGIAELRAGLAEVQAAIGVDPVEALRELGGGGAVGAFHLRGLKPTVTAVLRAPDAAAGSARVRSLLAAGAEAAGYPGALDEPVETIAGADVWQVGDDLHVAHRDGLTFLSNDAGGLRESLDLAGDAGARGWLAREDAAAAVAARAGDAGVWAFADLGAARALTARGKGESAKNLAKLVAAAREPRVQGLLGPGVARLGTADAVTLELRDGAGGPELVARATGLEPSPLTPSAPAGALPLAPGSGAEVVLYRDLATFVAEREELFEPRMVPVIAQKLGELQLVVGGLDLERELLPHLSPWFQVVVREVAFEHGPRPDLRFPAAALVARVDDPELVGETLLAGFQNLVALTNVQRAQEGARPRVMRLRRVGQADVTTAHLPAPLEGEGVDLGYNLAPACALVGDAFVVATHEDLLRELCAELSAAPRTVAPDASPTERILLRGPAFAPLVRSQLDSIAWQQVLEKGLELEEAERRIDGLARLLEALERVELACAYPSDTEVVLSLSVDLDVVDDTEAPVR